jgi:hypothetical protein
MGSIFWNVSSILVIVFFCFPRLTRTGRKDDSLARETCGMSVAGGKVGRGIRGMARNRSTYNNGPTHPAGKQIGGVCNLMYHAKRKDGGDAETKRTAAGIPTWSPTVVLICRSTAYVWQSGRDAQFSADYGRTCLISKILYIYLICNVLKQQGYPDISDSISPARPSNLI